MPKDYLDWAILGVGSLLLLTWLGILYSYIYKQQRHRKEQLIEATFAELVSNYLYGDPHESLNFLEIQRSFRKLKIYRDHPKNVQFLIDLMLRGEVLYTDAVRILAEVADSTAPTNRWVCQVESGASAAWTP